ncbi:quinone oxidoreductase-like protein 2 [Hylaeus volcanicus]|uniref:quinone oxidoreductase-like protein 2 n=1 Tax=Hylaeus volcanicus TaxID=313075 RepID=UPI0023B8585C|nr:quinone oxidoreductase-like protein 2 [Hylaeus volcanicus]
MSASVGRRFLTHFCGNHLKKLLTRTKVVRFISTTNPNLEDPAKTKIPASENICAAVLKQFSNPLIVETIEPPKISQPNEVLIDVQYCALNASDVLLAKNLYSFEPCLPMVLGQELVGKLIEVGEEAQKCGYKVGDKVIALNKDNNGGLSNRCVAEVSDIWRVPSGMKSLDAACLLNDYINALVALERKVSIQEDDMILINVGMSSVGLAAVDLATNVFMAQVIAVCATEDGADLAREKGVLASFKFKDRKLLKQIKEVAADKDIKVIFDDADGEYIKKVLDCFTGIYKSGSTIKDLLCDNSFAVVVHHLSREGRLIIAGTAATMTKTDSDNFSVTGFSLREYRKQKPEEYRQAGEDVFQFFDEGLIKPTLELTVGLNNVNDALQSIVDSKCTGKVIVDIKNNEAELKKLKE